MIKRPLIRDPFGSAQGGLGGGLFSGLEVFADAETVRPAGDSPGGDAIAVFVAGDVECSIGRVKVTASTGNLAPTKFQLLAIKQLRWCPHGESNPAFRIENPMS